MTNGQGVNMELHELGLPVIDYQTCNRWYREVGVSVTKLIHICAGYENGQKDACLGDSGGPLICVENHRPIIRGIVSWGIGCAERHRPGIYTRYTHALTNTLNLYQKTNLRLE